MFCCAFASICVFVYLITASDYYHFIELLTPEEQAVRKRVREFMEKEVAPIMTEVCLSSSCLFVYFDNIIAWRHILLSLIFTHHQYWEKAEFPFHIIPKLGALGVVGGSIKVSWNALFLFFLYVDGRFVFFFIWSGFLELWLSWPLHHSQCHCNSRDI